MNYPFKFNKRGNTSKTKLRSTQEIKFNKSKLQNIPTSVFDFNDSQSEKETFSSSLPVRTNSRLSRKCKDVQYSYAEEKITKYKRERRNETKESNNKCTVNVKNCIERVTKISSNENKIMTSCDNNCSDGSSNVADTVTVVNSDSEKEIEIEDREENDGTNEIVDKNNSFVQSKMVNDNNDNNKNSDENKAVIENNAEHAKCNENIQPLLDSSSMSICPVCKMQFTKQDDIKSILLHITECINTQSLETGHSTEKSGVNDTNQSKLSSEKCPVCNLCLSDELTIRDKEVHINNCLDKGDVTPCKVQEKTDKLLASRIQIEILSEDTNLFTCTYCGKDLAHWNFIRRESHVNKCKDKNVVAREESTKSKKGKKTNLKKGDKKGSTAVKKCPICMKLQTNNIKVQFLFLCIHIQ